MKISDIAQGGGQFKASVGPGSFNKKLHRAVRHGDLRNLSDNKESIIKAVKTHERAIKLGRFDRVKRINAWKIVKKNDPNLSKKDARDIKKLFNHLAEGERQVEPLKKEIKIEKDLDKDKTFSFEKRRKAIDGANVLSRVKNTKIDTRLGARVSVEQLNMPKKREPESSRALLLKDKSAMREKMRQARMPSERVHYDKEREKRLEVSSFERDLNKKFNPLADKDESDDKKNKSRGYEPFQNL